MKSSLGNFFNCSELSDSTLEIREKHESEASKRSKLEPTTLAIHSLLFCSNSEFFCKLLIPPDIPLAANSLQHADGKKLVRLEVSQNETTGVLGLVKLFYDESLVDDLSLEDSLRTLKFSVRYQCKSINERLLARISRCSIRNVPSLNKVVESFYEMVDSSEASVVAGVKKACLRYLKHEFCPCEKVSGPILDQFLSLDYNSVLFFLQYTEEGISTTEETVISFLLYWLGYHKPSQMSSKEVFALIGQCRFENITDVTYLLDVMTRNHPFLSKYAQYNDFYVNTLEHFLLSLTPQPVSAFPNRALRQLNFARDHDVMLYFEPCTEEQQSLRLSMVTQEPNIMFVRGYQISLHASILSLKCGKELQVNVTVANSHAKKRHSKLEFTMLYSIASPSVSETFSPWSCCLFSLGSETNSTWSTVSLIAEHSLIHETGFYLRCFVE